MRHTERVPRNPKGESVTAPATGPTAVRRQLGVRLKRWRLAAGLEIEEVIANPKLGISRAKLYKLEAGKHPAKPQDVAVLCKHYNVPDAEADALTGLALATTGDIWWHVYGSDSVPEWFSIYVDLEPAAKRYRGYDAELVPGLLQTERYAWAVYRARNPDKPEAELERRVGVRMERQAILDREDPAPPEMDVVLSEAVLLRQVGGPEVMAEQLDKLRKMGQRPGISVRVLPLAAGAHAAMETAFVMLDFAEPEDDPSLVYIETPSSAAYLQSQTEIERYTTIFDAVRSPTMDIQEYRS